MNTLPCFKSHYSFGKSILTVDSPQEDESGPISILSLAQKSNLQEVVLVEDNFSSFLEAFKNTKALGLKLVYGIRMFVTESVEENSPDFVCKRSKIVVFMKNTDGYRDLCRIWSFAASEGLFSGVSREAKSPHIDYKHLKKFWSKNLMLAVPFYDSFLYMNTLNSGACVPDFSFTSPVFFCEDNDLPFDQILQSRLEEYLSKTKEECLPVQSVFYNRKNDFIPYLTARCINNRSTLEKPDLEHMSSDNFCFEAWEDKNV